MKREICPEPLISDELCAVTSGKVSVFSASQTPVKCDEQIWRAIAYIIPFCLVFLYFLLRIFSSA